MHAQPHAQSPQGCGSVSGSRHVTGAGPGRGVSSVARQRQNVSMESRFGFPHITLLWVVATTIACGAPELSPEAAVLAVVSPEVLERMRATPHDYFRFINHEWTARVSDVFASDVPHLPTVQLHGRQVRDVGCKDIAHSRCPFVIDESEVVVRRRAHAFEYFWRHNGEHGGLRTELRRAAGDRRRNDPEQRDVWESEPALH